MNSPIIYYYIMYTEIVLEISIDGYRCDDVNDDDDESRGFHSIIVCGIFRVQSSNRQYMYYNNYLSASRTRVVPHAHPTRVMYTGCVKVSACAGNSFFEKKRVYDDNI